MGGGGLGGSVGGGVQVGRFGVVRRVAGGGGTGSPYLPLPSMLGLGLGLGLGSPSWWNQSWFYNPF